MAQTNESRRIHKNDTVYIPSWPLARRGARPHAKDIPSKHEGKPEMTDSADKDLPIAENNACARPIRSTRSNNKASIAAFKPTSRGSGRRPTTRSCSKLQAGFIKPESHDEAIIGPTINSVAKKSRAKVAVKQPNDGRIKYFNDLPLDALATPEDTSICNTALDSDLDRHGLAKTATSAMTEENILH